MNIVRLLRFILPISSVVCDDYDFNTYEDINWDDTEQVWKEGGDITMTWSEAIDLMKMEEIEHYKDIIEEKERHIKEIEWEKRTIMETWEEEKEEREKLFERKANQLESEHEETRNEFAGKLKNKNILIRFLSTLLQKNEKRYKQTHEVIKKQSEKLKLLKAEKKQWQEKEKRSLRQGYLQTKIMLSQEREIHDLKEAVKLE